MLIKIMDWQVCHSSAGKHEYAAMIAVNEPIILSQIHLFTNAQHTCQNAGILIRW